MADLEIFAVVLGDSSPSQHIFSIEASDSISVGEFKKLVHAEGPTILARCKAADLVLWKLNTAIHADRVDEEVAAFGQDPSAVAEKMNPLHDLSKYFPSKPPRKSLHIIAHIPATSTTTPPNNPASLLKPNTTPRQIEVPIYSELAMSNAKIDRFIQGLRPKIRDFLTNQRLPNWVPRGSVDEQTREFYNGLAIPLVKGEPNLLLHGLGDTPNPNVDNLFPNRQHLGGPYDSVNRSSLKHRILWNTSGSGKTRLLFDGLCRHWGFYFVIAQGPDGIGARDLESMIEIMPRSSGWINDIFADRNPASANTVNCGIASRRIEKVLLARWVVFNTFIQVAKELNGGVLHDTIRLDWLFFQIFPIMHVNGMDPFLALIDTCLIGVSFDALCSLRTSLAPEKVLGSDFNPTVESFFYVLDGAQVAGKQYMSSFSDPDGKVPRPVLGPIIRHLSSFVGTLVKVIVSGTGLSLELFKTASTWGVGKDSSMWHIVHETGDFTDQNKQLAYIARYLPPSFLLSQSGKVLVARMYEWLRGRHRFTARYLEELMRHPWKENHPASPHKLLNAYVHRIADFTPLDGDIAISEQEPYVGPVWVDGFQWKKIEQDQRLLNELSHSIYTYIATGEYPMWYHEGQSLVEYGLARFIRDTPNVEERKPVNVEEPLALVGIVRYFESHHLTLDGNIRARLRDDKGKAFEEVVLFAITKLLRNGQELRHIFRFQQPIPAWARCTAQIVARKSSGDVENFELVVDQPVLPSTGVALSAKDPDDVKHWLESGGAGWCVPGAQMGPGLMAWLRLSDGRLLLLVVQAKCRLTGNTDTVTADVTAHAIRPLIPSRFFAPMNGETMTETAGKQLDQTINTMLAAISKPEERFTTGEYNILRVVAAFPLHFSFHSNSADVESALAEDKHALALLPQSALASALAASPHGHSIMSMLTRVLKRTRGQVDDEAEEVDDEAETRQRSPKSRRTDGA